MAQFTFSAMIQRHVRVASISGPIDLRSKKDKRFHKFRSFKKGQAPGKLSVHEDDFACVV